MPQLEAYYHTQFFRDQADTALASARAVAPLVHEMIGPRSVVDVGCGVAAWARAFADLGVERVLGIDGAYVQRSQLLIAPDQFVAHDLERPLPAVGRFDLAVCLEVAEHLSAARAVEFVGELTRLAPVVLFSAAAPLQGGENHLNEQWPEYWERLFAGHGYVAFDALRHRIWHNRRVDWWYRQNVLLFVHEAELDAYPDVQPYWVDPGADRLTLVSRRVLEAHQRQAGSLRHLLRALPGALRAAVRNRTP
jgi:SAM-dependent methyltransferase